MSVANEMSTCADIRVVAREATKMRIWTIWLFICCVSSPLLIKDFKNWALFLNIHCKCGLYALRANWCAGASCPSALNVGPASLFSHHIWMLNLTILLNNIVHCSYGTIKMVKIIKTTIEAVRMIGMENFRCTQRSALLFFYKKSIRR